MVSARFLSLFALVAVAYAQNTTVTKISVDVGTQDLSGTQTDSSGIADTASQVDQKSGPAPDAPPNLPPVNTTVTAVDGSLVNDSVPTNTSATSDSSDSDSSRRRRRAYKRVPHIARGLKRQDEQVESEYTTVFTGTGTGPYDRDASIEGTAYLTFTTVDNSTYNIDACLEFCDSVDTCIFANLYYELNNPGLDASSSNLKCAVYADIHSAAEKTNFGGQQLYPEGQGGLTFIQNSSGFAGVFADPPTPDGYELVFGPTDGANNAPGYMGFAFLSSYDVAACAALCNTRGADANGGACQYFNIWRALVNEIPTTYTCSMYFIPSDASTAVNTGQGDLKVTFSRGYQRISVLPDGGFEDTPCDSEFCFTESTATWTATSPPGGDEDALIFFFQPYAFSGNGVGTLGSGDGADSLSGTLTPANPLNTEAGKTYSINFFHASNFNGDLESGAILNVVWNGVTVFTITPGDSPYTFYQTTAVAQGNDVIQFVGGSYPAYDFIDNIFVFLA